MNDWEYKFDVSLIRKFNENKILINLRNLTKTYYLSAEILVNGKSKIYKKLEKENNTIFEIEEEFNKIETINIRVINQNVIVQEYKIVKRTKEINNIIELKSKNFKFSVPYIYTIKISNKKNQKDDQVKIRKNFYSFLVKIFTPQNSKNQKEFLEISSFYNNSDILDVSKITKFLNIKVAKLSILNYDEYRDQKDFELKILSDGFQDGEEWSDSKALKKYEFSNDYIFDEKSQKVIKTKSKNVKGAIINKNFNGKLLYELPLEFEFFGSYKFTFFEEYKAKEKRITTRKKYKISFEEDKKIVNEEYKNLRFSISSEEWLKVLNKEKIDNIFLENKYISAIKKDEKNND
ncbi:hypothetical protein [Mycoplasma crocodyli]|uniref:hypothetical protein n=1 Tax=Mycoplasma crocodyli TaxID=50052 RepID=UPI0002DB76FF|nr:hypothetical protein [Mycoplasma crocodyli]